MGPGLDRPDAAEESATLYEIGVQPLEQKVHAEPSAGASDVEVPEVSIDRRSVRPVERHRTLCLHCVHAAEHDAAVQTRHPVEVRPRDPIGVRQPESRLLPDIAFHTENVEDGVASPEAENALSSTAERNPISVPETLPETFAAAIGLTILRV